MLLAGLVVFLLIPFLNKVVGRALGASFVSDPWTLLALLAFTVLIGLFSGIYPAMVSSRYQAVQALKGTIQGRAEEDAGAKPVSARVARAHGLGATSSTQRWPFSKKTCSSVRARRS